MEYTLEFNRRIESCRMSARIVSFKFAMGFWFASLQDWLF
jgi:hypothetical protein